MASAPPAQQQHVPHSREVAVDVARAMARTEGWRLVAVYRNHEGRWVGCFYRPTGYPARRYVA